jgi:hypothetical protein
VDGRHKACHDVVKTAFADKAGSRGANASLSAMVGIIRAPGV